MKINLSLSHIRLQLNLIYCNSLNEMEVIKYNPTVFAPQELDEMKLCDSSLRLEAQSANNKIQQI